MRKSRDWREYDRSYQPKTEHEEERRDIAVCNVPVPPKSRTWSEEHHRMVEDTTHFLQRVTEESNNVILEGDFNCKEVHWEDWSAVGGEGTWGNKLLGIAMDNGMTQ